MTIDTGVLASYAADNNTMMSILNDVQKAQEETCLSDRQAECFVLSSYGFANEHIVECVKELNSETSAGSSRTRAKKKIEKSERTAEFAEEMEEKGFGRVRA